MKKIITNAVKEIEDVCEIVCMELCKYQATTDEEFICDYMREHDGKCPLDRLH